MNDSLCAFFKTSSRHGLQCNESSVKQKEKTMTGKDTAETLGSIRIAQSWGAHFLH